MLLFTLFLLLLFKNRIIKNEGTGSVEYTQHFESVLMLFVKNNKNESALVKL